MMALPATRQTSAATINAAADRRGFTLMEALAALVLIAVVLPVAMHAVSLATLSAGTAARRVEAINLAESRLAELISTEQWRSGTLQGDFSQTASDLPAPHLTDQAGYQWRAWTEPWVDMAMVQLHVEVSWLHRGSEQQVQLVTLVRDEGR